MGRHLHFVTGNHSGGFKSDDKMRKQIQALVNKTKMIDAIIVSDDSELQGAWAV